MKKEFHWMKVISYQKQIVRLLVVMHHEDIYELTSLIFLKLNLGYQNFIWGKKTWEHILFLSFMRLCYKSAVP